MSTSIAHPPAASTRRTAILVASCLALLVLSTILLAYLAGQRERGQLLAAQQSRMAASVKLRSAGMAADIEQLRRDALFLAEAVPRQSSAQLAQVLSAFLASKPELGQTRLIGVADGWRELVHVDRRGARISVAPAGRLERLGERDYVRAAAALAPGQVHMSDFSLQREAGRIEYPLRRVLRAATPVFDANGRLTGVVVLNLNLDAPLARLHASQSGDFRLYLLDGNGDYLLQPDAARSFGQERGQRWRWQDEHQPVRRADGMAARHGQEVHYLAVSRVRLDPERRQRDLTLIVALPEARLAPAINAARLHTLLITLSGTLLGSGALLLLYRLRRRAARERAELATIVASSHDAIIGKTLDGVITSWNGGAERIFGYSAQEACGRPLAQLLMPGCDVEEERQILQRIRGGEVISSHETRRRRKDGTLVDVSVTISPIRAASGKVIGAAKTVRDISAQKASAAQILELNRSLERQVIERTAQIRDLAAQQQAILDNAAYAIIASDISGRVTVFNPAAQRLLGHAADEVIGQVTPMIFHNPAEVAARAAEFARELGQPLAPGFDVLVAKALRGLPNEHEWTFLCKDGARVPVLLSVTALKHENGTLIGYLGMAADLSERRAARHALEVRTSEAEAANRAKSDFLANMSHEIRTPMNAVLGMLKLLRQSPLQARQADHANKAEQAARALLGLLNNILDFSRVEAGKLGLEAHAFKLDRLLAETAVILAANLGHKRIELLYDLEAGLPAWIIADPLRLQQVLINLTGNAIKFTDSGEVVLSCRRASGPEEPLRLAFFVRDSGIGIAADQCERIFEGFSQAEASTARRYGGSGLGLAISQRLVQLMGGELRVDSRPGAGSTFSFDIDCTATQAPAGTPLPAADLQGLRCLLADDHAGARRVLAAMLASFGCHVDIAGSAAAALALAAGGAGYDLMLLDWDMAGPDSAALCRQLRGMAPDGKLVALLDGHAGALGGPRADGADADQPDALLVKPVTASALCDSITGCRTAATLAKPRHRPGQRLAGLHLLVVEDNALNRQLAFELLRNEGAAITLADCGQAALDILGGAAERCDAVLMDVQMPGMDGYAATRALRALPHAGRLPVIAVTANAMASDRAAALAAGMDQHVGKPFDLEQLVAVILALTGGVPATPARASPVLSDAQPVLNTAAALSRCGGQTALYRRLLHGFVPEIEALAVRLRNAPAADAALLHQIKGLAATAGAERVAALARQAEQSALQDGGAARQAIEALLAALPAACAAARQTAGEDERPPEEEPAAGELAQELEALMRLLAGANGAAVPCFDALRSRHGASAPDGMLRLAAMVDELRFAEALEQAAVMLRAIKLKENTT